MPGRPAPIALHRSRNHIATEVRALRAGRGWTLGDLAKRLYLSTSRLSEIERGGGSFTAEQLLLILKIFNVPASHFANAEHDDHSSQLQNAVARLGGRHLHEGTDSTPSELLHDAHITIREVLLDGSPRLITALAPVLVRNIQHLNLARVHADLTDVGHWNRLGWLIDNTLYAIEDLLPSKPRDLILVEAHLRLGLFAKRLRDHRTEKPPIEDILDASIRSERTLNQVRKAASSISKEWRVVTSIQPHDFIKALKAGLAVD